MTPAPEQLNSEQNQLQNQSQNQFTVGCDMWILINNPKSAWWKKINFATGFLLSSLNEKTKNSFTNALSQETENILTLTGLPHFNFKSDSKIAYLSVENHVPARWICLINSAADLNSPHFLNNLKSLKCNNLRLFLNEEIPTGLKASFPDLQIVCDSH